MFYSNSKLNIFLTADGTKKHRCHIQIWKIQVDIFQNYCLTFTDQTIIEDSVAVRVIILYLVVLLPLCRAYILSTL